MDAPGQVPTPSAEQPRTPPHISRANQIAEAFVLAALLAAPALVCLHMALVSDPDVWWHMRAAQWIIDHHSIPHADPFSRIAGTPWQAYSWLFDLIVLKCFNRFGLAGLVAYSTALVLAIAAAIYHLIRRLQPDFSLAVLLALVASLSLMRLFTPRPWLFTILFFTLQLDILMHARRMGKSKELLWLPLLYVLWANTHIQFIDGLVVLAIALGESIFARWWTPARTRVSPAWLGGTFIACILATFLNPYGIGIYKIAYGLASQAGALKFIAEMHALEFRSPADFCMVFLALAATAALAWRTAQPPREASSPRSLPIFEALLLAFAAVVSFRTGRDMWVMVIAASAILAQSISAQSIDSSETKHRPAAVFTLPITVAALAVILFLGSRVLRVNQARLQSQLADHFPVRAVEAVRKNNYSGPLFNNFDWGGYLIWSLRMPVSVDGRADFYGDKRLSRSFSTWNAASDWSSNPDLQSANLVIGPVDAPLTQLLRLDPHFQLAYEDKLAAVFTRRK